jgi:putative membrane protein
MSAGFRIKRLIGLFVGLGAVAALVAWQGFESVAAQISGAGWWVVLICVLYPFIQAINAEAWRWLFPDVRRPRSGETLIATCVGNAVNTLLPVATIGGEIVKARVLTLWAHAAGDTISTTVVDKTIQAVVVVLWALVGIAMLAAVAPDPLIVVAALIGAVLLALGIAGFIAVQLAGSLSFITRIGGRVAPTGWIRRLAGSAAHTDALTRAIYTRPGALAVSAALRLAVQMILVGEVVFAAYLIGVPVTLADAVMIKALAVGLRGIAFAVPAGLGVQEGGFVAVGLMVGLPPEMMIAISLTTRTREILPAIPFLFIWQHIEGRALWRRMAAAEGGKNETS